MDNALKFAVIGGDRRMIEVIRIISAKGLSVKVWGIDEKYVESSICVEGCEEAVRGADIVILPTPTSEDDVRINCPLFSKESGIKMHKMLDMLKKDAMVFGGRMSPRLREYIAQRGLKSFDYFNKDELLVKNAVPTAEGAIGIAIEKMPRMLLGSKIAVLGFGRIGEALSSRLKLLGANVTVYARKSLCIAKAQSDGYNGVKIEFNHGESSLMELTTKGYHLIYNTVPHWIVTEDIVERLPKDTLFVDLASAPGGIDLVAAKKFEYEVVRAPSLPSKVAPVSAGEIIAESIFNIIEEEL